MTGVKRAGHVLAARCDAALQALGGLLVSGLLRPSIRALRSG